jgi:hypothetical protein
LVLLPPKGDGAAVLLEVKLIFYTVLAEVVHSR